MELNDKPVQQSCFPFCWAKEGKFVALDRPDLALGACYPPIISRILLESSRRTHTSVFLVTTEFLGTQDDPRRLKFGYVGMLLYVFK